MCGFVGFTNKINDASIVLGKMMDRIKHRGPDSDGKYVDEQIAMGFRRLSIIDLSDQGSQPIFNEDKSLVLTFNGEIYNYKDLREELVASGHKFYTQTDSEVLIHGYEQWGEDMLDKLRGMFAFVIFNKNTNEVFGARDFFGIKPLYYAKMGETLMWGSEIKSFLDHPHFKKELNTDVLETYLTFQYSPTTETFFKNVYKLPAAHCFTYKNGEMNVRRYWEVKFHADNGPSLEDWVNRISDTFKNSVEVHKFADVEVGSFLSSGVDSSYVAAVANVDKTFTVGFGEDEKYNEIGYAKEFSKYINKENYSKVISPEEYWNSLSKIQYHMDEPLADPAAVALFFVCQIASEKVKAVLSGEGADEIFGGYNIYHNPADMASYFKIPRPIRKAVGAVAEKLPHKHGINYLIRGSKDLDERFIGNAYIFSEKERKDILSIKTNAPDAMAITKPFYDKVRDQDQVTQMQYIDLHLWMTGDILLKADKMSMAHSLELRVPFLDRKVMELAEQIPVKDRVTETETKYAMRLAALQACPPQTAKKKKLGFPVPIRVWLKEDKYYNIVKDKFTSPQSAQFFHTDKLVQLLDDHRAGKYDYSRKIWTVFSFLVWYDVYFSDNV
ncbi:asparagine synthase (glutamine-hydrolyzing) [Ruminococcus bicirculans (ex Wegman et al. 2014)]|jgi:asparagine synthase (glutamine-hydrolysing)|uniref:asparagine synthase (glutamine-hydrolyzing) n=1 Tax=Ruminococcus bicirculans (ex Wegman et al. 2014) TaxID=1160721 RepID=UPI001644515B|nr:asparagine synthase (glutamine-hydrolyzing) [Ruminococcus bicirculans (ex Wegman et al. 2014)]MBC3512735.1 asparagine synthase (glutamine-hydrolyzing) [Ruminococcus bicirculans (ex Wegman et al. 2014)]